MRKSEKLLNKHDIILNMKIIIFLLIFLVLGVSFAEDDWYEEGGEESSDLEYNVIEDEWEYKDEDETLRYNIMEDKWGFAEEDERLKYNPLDDRWEFSK